MVIVVVDGGVFIVVGEEEKKVEVREGIGLLTYELHTVRRPIP